MSLPSDADRRFIEQRRARRGFGTYGLTLLLFVVVGGWLSMFVWFPLAVNPLHAVGYFEGQPIEPGTLTKYAIVISMLVDALFVLFAAALVLAILWTRHESRYLRLLGALQRKVEALTIEQTQAAEALAKQEGAASTPAAPEAKAIERRGLFSR